MKAWPLSRCARVRRAAAAFLDGRLAAPARAAVQQHLHGCSGCLRELRQLARIGRAMHNLPPFRIADGMAARLRRQLAAAPLAAAPRLGPSAPRRRAWWRATEVALAAVAAATLFWLGYARGLAAAGVPVPEPIANPVAPVPVPDPVPPPPPLLVRERVPAVQQELPPPASPPPVPARLADFPGPAGAGATVGAGGSRQVRSEPFPRDARELLAAMLRDLLGDDVPPPPPRR